MVEPNAVVTSSAVPAPVSLVNDGEWDIEFRAGVNGLAGPGSADGGAA